MYMSSTYTKVWILCLPHAYKRRQLLEFRFELCEIVDCEETVHSERKGGKTKQNSYLSFFIEDHPDEHRAERNTIFVNKCDSVL